VKHLEAKDVEAPERSHNLMVFGDIDVRRHARKLVNHLGVDFEPTDS
jgi:oligosaccharyltransferase complex subunit beta